MTFSSSAFPITSLLDFHEESLTFFSYKDRKNPPKNHPENTLHACIICASRTGHLLAVHPYLLRDVHQCVSSPSLLDTQALDST